MNINHEIKHIWLHGEGNLKAFCRKRYPDAYMKCPSNALWPGYIDESVVIMADLAYRDFRRISYLKQWGGPNPFPIRLSRTRTIDIRPLLIIITSKEPPRNIWKRSVDYVVLEELYNVTHVGDDLTDADAVLYNKRMETLEIKAVQIEAEFERLYQQECEKLAALYATYTN